MTCSRRRVNDVISSLVTAHGNAGSNRIAALNAAPWVWSGPSSIGRVSERPRRILMRHACGCPCCLVPWLARVRKHGRDSVSRKSWYQPADDGSVSRRRYSASDVSSFPTLGSLTETRRGDRPGRWSSECTRERGRLRCVGMNVVRGVVRSASLSLPEGRLSGRRWTRCERAAVNLRVTARDAHRSTDTAHLKEAEVAPARSPVAEH